MQKQFNSRGMSSAVGWLFSALIFIVIAGGLAVSLFGIFNTSINGAPSWLAGPQGVFNLIVAAGLIFGVWRVLRLK